MTFLHWLVGSYLVLNAVYSLPIDDNAIDYLRNFGYLPKKNMLAERFGDDILHEDVVTNALKLLQKFGNIKQSGVLDKDTKELLKKPRCGNPDFDEPPTINNGRSKRYILGPTKWGKKDITWAFVNKNHPRSSSDFHQIERLIDEAMSIWQHNSNLKLIRTRSEDADILVDFARLDHGDGYNFTGPGYTLAHAFYPGTKLGGDVHLDDDENWDIENGQEGEVNFFTTVLHEIGHSLGMGHSSEQNSIMYPYYYDRKFDRKCKMLYDDDINGIGQHYGKVERFRFGPQCVDGRRPTERPYRVPVERTRETSPRVRPTTERPRYTSTHRFETTEAPKPSECNTTFDAITILRNELMAFKGRWMWRLRRDERDGKFHLLPGSQPSQLSRMWRDLESFDRIDAVFEMKDGNFAFFIGQRVYVFATNRLLRIRDIRDMGFSENVQKIDAIVRYGESNKTFVFSGEKYWRVNDDLNVDVHERHQYPRNINTFWKKLDWITIDTAFQVDGITYFVQDHFSYRFMDDFRHGVMLDNKHPLITSQHFMSCDMSHEEITTIRKLARIQDEATSIAPPPTTTISSQGKMEPRKTFVGVIYMPAIEDLKINSTKVN